MSGATRCVAGLAAAMLFTGCVLTPKFTPPRLSIVNVQLEGGDLWEQRLKVRLHVENPNNRALPVKGLEYTLEVAGQQLARGASAASFIVPAMGESEFDTNVTTNLAGALLKLLGRSPEALGQSVEYHLTGKVSLSAGLLRSIPFDERGRVRLQ
jgi:LEA14-like dessication related protein